MSERFTGVECRNEEMIFDPKKINLPYTLFIIKPETCLDWTVSQEIISLLEEKGFEIKSVANRELTRQEVENLYYKHEKKPYFTDLVSYNSTGESLVLLLSHKSEDPISLLQTVIGDKDPAEAKKLDPDCLRAKHGKDIIKNEFYCSDDQLGANKDRDIFMFPIPQKEPDFKMESKKVSLSMLWSFLHPKNMEHSEVVWLSNQRSTVGLMCLPFMAQFTKGSL